MWCGGEWCSAVWCELGCHCTPPFLLLLSAGWMIVEIGVSVHWCTPFPSLLCVTVGCIEWHRFVNSLLLHSLRHSSSLLTVWCSGSGWLVVNSLLLPFTVVPSVTVGWLDITSRPVILSVILYSISRPTLWLSSDFLCTVWFLLQSVISGVFCDFYDSFCMPLLVIPSSLVIISCAPPTSVILWFFLSPQVFPYFIAVFFYILNCNFF